MSTSIVTSISQMPLGNLITLIIGLVLLIIIGAIVIRFLHISKLGPLELEHSNQALNAEVHRGLDDIDDDLRSDIWSMTASLTRQAVASAGLPENLCYLARRAIMYVVSVPLQDAAISNHFTKKLMPDKVDSYERQIFDTIKDYYIELYSGAKVSDSGQLIPDWDIVAKTYESLTHEWVVRTARLVITACQNKISIYETTLEKINDKSDYWYIVFNNCLQKNKRYIQELTQIK